MIWLRPVGMVITGYHSALGGGVAAAVLQQALAIYMTTHPNAHDRLVWQVGVPKVKVRVENSDLAGDHNSILLDPIDFLRGFSVLKDQLVRDSFRTLPFLSLIHI